ncbi:hypothetical protein Patl1_10105 [Pistacia atlantica]|uniref:Uncharacterized protein n=1 Tax=Pistacia atlantica TaxID=434234 RepID=A0ACC1A3M7_9ROSI|nr:hypothetical protein Patl1_10105 [Pistacia atlantica]
MERDKEDTEEVKKKLSELNMELYNIKHIISLHLVVSDGKVEDVSNVSRDSKETGEESQEILLKRQGEVKEILLDSSNQEISIDIEDIPTNIEGPEEEDKLRDSISLIDYYDEELGMVDRVAKRCLKACFSFLSSIVIQDNGSLKYNISYM